MPLARPTQDPELRPPPAPEGPALSAVPRDPTAVVAVTAALRRPEEGDAAGVEGPEGAGDSAPRAGEGLAPPLRRSIPPGADEAPRESFAKPVLASEALMEDLAPVEPAGQVARLWCAAVGSGFLLFGVLPLVHLRRGGVASALPSFVIGSIALMAALARVTYRQRAVAMVVLGLLSGTLGLRGPDEAVSLATGWNLMRMVAAVALPGALLFRAHYRAYAGARLFLGAALLAALPFAAHAVTQIASHEFGLAQLGSVIAVGAVLASLAGFMGSETTGAGSYMAPGLVLVFTGELTLQAIAATSALDTVASIGEVVSSALAFAGASALASLGMFQILAWRFAADARRIDLHAEVKEKPRLGESSGEWSTRG